MNELKPCPFCGSPLNHCNAGTHSIDCYFAHNSNNEYPLDVYWNTRPLEHALEHKLAIAQIELQERSDGTKEIEAYKKEAKFWEDRYFDSERKLSALVEGILEVYYDLDANYYPNSKIMETIVLAFQKAGLKWT